MLVCPFSGLCATNISTSFVAKSTPPMGSAVGTAQLGPLLRASHQAPSRCSLPGRGATPKFRGCWQSSAPAGTGPGASSPFRLSAGSLLSSKTKMRSWDRSTVSSFNRCLSISWVFCAERPESRGGAVAGGECGIPGKDQVQRERAIDAMQGP